MTAVYKRELRSYLTSMIGYLFMFFILLLTGIYFSAYQLAAAYPKFEYTLSALTFVFLISVPILTMRVLAEERKQKTDQLLLTSPVSVEKIVLGKYLALVTIFAIPMIIMCLYPLLMSKFGTVSFAAAYTAILGFFLLGCANLAIGVFISSLTESQVIAAVLTFVFLFAFYMMNGISSFFSESSSYDSFMMLIPSATPRSLSFLVSGRPETISESLFIICFSFSDIVALLLVELFVLLSYNHDTGTAMPSIIK